MGEDLAVAGVGCLRAEHDRRALGAAEDLVEQRELHLAVAGAAEMRAEVRRPQPAFLDDPLQRRDQRLAHWIVEVVGLLDDQVDRARIPSGRTLPPMQLLCPFRDRWRSPTPLVVLSL